MDKILSKLIFAGQVSHRGGRLVQPPSVARRPPPAIREAESRVGYPLVVKPAVAGSSVGIARAANAQELVRAVAQAIQFSARILAEKALDDRIEVQCAVLGNHEPVVSECEELTQSAGIVSFEDKYLKRPDAAEADLAPSHIPARIPEDLARRAKALALATFTALDARGIARVDFLVDRPTMQLFVNEVNTLPGSLCLRLWEASGIAPAALVRRLPDWPSRRTRRRTRTFESREGAGLVDRKHLADSRKVGGACCTISVLLWLIHRAPQRLPVRYLPDGGGVPDGAVHHAAPGTAGHRQIGGYAGAASGAGRRSAEPPQEGRHADHGRRADPSGGDGGHAAVGSAQQPVHLAGPAHDAGHGAVGFVDDY
jgi:hypothetical protein